MNEKSIPPKHLDSKYIPVDGDKAVRDFLDLDRATPIVASPVTRKVRTNELLPAYEDDSSMSTRPESHRNKRSRKPVVFVGGIATGALLTIGAMNGAFSEADGEKQLSDYDQLNKQENIADNPALFNPELHEDPSQTTIEVEK